MKRFAPIFLLAGILAFACQSEKEEGKREAFHFNDSLILQASNLMGLTFTDEEKELMRGGLESLLRRYEYMRAYSLPNTVRPALFYRPLPSGFVPEHRQEPIEWGLEEDISLPGSVNDLAFMPVHELSVLIRTGKISSEELTRFFIDRLKKHNDSLLCVVSLCEELALEQARRADEELAAGTYRGPLHGIPYGVKDLFSVPGYKTTWGAMPYKDRELDDKATVVEKLEEAGAVLVAKFSMGALAMGDVWFGGRTRNPWNLRQGSSGSSAGSAAATAAGLIPFALGTETLGSIVSPSTRCGVTGLRPTFGRVSKHGAMALSWSMDKIGPICRSAEDCALVFDVIRGYDPRDPSTLEAAFNYRTEVDLSELRIGYYKEAFDREYRNRKQDLETLKVLRKAGARLIPVSFEVEREVPLNALRIILTAEASAAFDELTRTGEDSSLVRQDRGAWPNTFRQGRFIPAVEYIQANRHRRELLEKMHGIMQEFDVVVTPSYGGNQLLVTNLTGHPCVVVPNGFTEYGSPTSISFLGNLFDEATVLSVVKAYQEATNHDDQRPPLFLEN
jgi:Asp-tRNA(Asn)/Glu-tRNA(Gln) amidotransferase A subunit family amidase